MACDRELRQAVKGLARKVTLAHKQDLDLLTQHNWPNLTVIHLLADTAEYSFRWPQGKLELMATVRLKQHNSRSTVFLIRVKHVSLRQELNWLALAMPFSILGLVLLVLFCMSAIVSVVLTTCIIRELLKPGSNLVLGKQQTQARKGDALDASSAASLQAAPTMDAYKRALIKAKGHQMQFMATGKLGSGVTEVKHAAMLMTDMGSDLTEMTLHCTSLGDASIAQMLTGPFPDLQYLVLGHNQLGLTETSRLVQATSTKLRYLTLAYCFLDAQAVQRLVTASWPHLCSLDLVGNALDSSAIKYLAMGKWPKLDFLTLAGFELDYIGLVVLTQVDWPWLGSLFLDISAACCEVFVLLNLDYKSADTASSWTLKMPRQLMRRRHQGFGLN